MKKITEHILGVLNSEIFNDFEVKLDQAIIANKWVIEEENEFSLPELIQDLTRIIDITKVSIENGIIDRLPYKIRNKYSESIDNIQSYLTYISTNQQYFPNLMDEVQNLSELIIPYLLNLNNIDSSVIVYNEIIAKLNELVSNAENKINEIEEKKNLSYELYNKIIETQTNINNTSEDVSKIKDALNALTDNYTTSLSNFESESHLIKEKLNELEKNNQTNFTELINKLDTDSKAKVEELSNVILSSDKSFQEFSSKIIQANELIKADQAELIKEFKNLISQYESSSQTSTQTIKTYLDESIKLKAQIQDYKEQSENFVKNVDSYKAVMQETNESFNTQLAEYKHELAVLSTTAKSDIKVYKDETENIVGKNSKLQEEIEHLLGYAIGTNLNSSFEARKDKIFENAKLCLIGICVGIILLLLIIFYLFTNDYFDKQLTTIINIENKVVLNSLLWSIKLGFTAPALYLIGFCTERYTKERRLEEEYAFKSSIATVLTPFSDLINKLKDDEKHREFLFKTINNIFQIPTDKVFKETNSQKLNLSDYNKNPLWDLINTATNWLKQKS